MHNMQHEKLTEGASPVDEADLLFVQCYNIIIG